MEPAPAPQQPAVSPYLEPARAAASKYGIPDNIYLGLISQESSWNPNALSTIKDKQGRPLPGAIGLSQILPSTAQGMGVDPAQLKKDPQLQIDLGARILRSNYDDIRKRLPGLTEREAWDKAIQAYNAGTPTVLGRGPLPRETQNYLPGVRAKAAQFGPGTPATMAHPTAVQGLETRAFQIGQAIQQGFANARSRAREVEQVVGGPHHPWIQGQIDAAKLGANVLLSPFTGWGIGPDLRPTDEYRKGLDVLTNVGAIAGAPTVGGEAMAARLTGVGGAAVRRALRPITGREADVSLPGAPIPSAPPPAAVATGDAWGNYIARTPVGTTIEYNEIGTIGPGGRKRPGIVIGTKTHPVTGEVQLEVEVGRRPDGRPVTEFVGAYDEPRTISAPMAQATRDLEVGQAIRNQIRQQIGADIPGPSLAADIRANTVRDANTPATVGAENLRLQTATPTPGSTFTTEGVARWWNVDNATAEARLREMADNGHVRQAGTGVWQMPAQGRTAADNAAAVAQAQAGSHPSGTPYTITTPTSPEARQAVAQAQARERMTGESGAMNLGALSDYLDHAGQVQQVQGDVADRLYQAERQTDGDALRLDRVLKPQRQTSMADREVAYHALEDPSEPMTPSQRQLYDVLAPMRDDTAAKKLAMKDTWPMIGTEQGYVRRFVMKKNNIIDRFMRTGQAPGRRGLATTTAAMKHRQMVTLTDERTGEEIIAHVEPGGHVRGWVNGQPEDLGPFGLKSRQELIDKEIAPFQRRIDRAEREVKTLTGLRLNPARVAALERRLSILASETMNLGRTNTPQDIIKIERDMAQLQNQIHVASGGGAIERRVGTIERGLFNLRTQAEAILKRYDPNTVRGKVFVSKVGGTERRFMVGQATTKEIEAATNGAVQYYKDGVASVLLDHFETNRAYRNFQLVESLKSDPEFLQLAAPMESNRAVAGWTTTRLDAFRGWLMDPHVAAELDRVKGKIDSGLPVPDALDHINRFLTTTMFLAPTTHLFNIGANWTFDRGVTPWFNPRSYKNLTVSTARAITAVLKTNKDYTDLLDAGAPLQLRRQATSQITEKILGKMREELQANPSVLQGLADALNHPLGRIVNTLTAPSHWVTWASQDIATLERIFEREMEGMTRADAIKETGRWIPNYRLPATIMGNRGLANMLSNRSLVIFAPYHYGILKSFGQAVKGLITGSGAERLRIADKLAALGVMGLVVARAINPWVKQITGDQRAYFRPPGQLSMISNVSRAVTGWENPLYAAESIVSPSPTIGIGMAELQRMREWDDPNLSPAERAGVGLKIALPELGPLQTRQAISGGGWDWGKIALSSMGIQVPKRGPAEIRLNGLRYDSPANLRPKLMHLVATGQIAEAHREIRRYNTDVYRMFLAAQRERGERQDTQKALAYVKAINMKIPTYQAALEYERKKQHPPPLGAPPRRRGGRTMYPQPLELDRSP